MRSTIIFSIVSLLAQQASQASAQLDSSPDVAGSHGAYLATRIRRTSDIELNASGYLKRRVESFYASTQPNPPVVGAINKDVAPAPSNSMAAMSPTSSMPAGPLNLNPMMNDTQSACAAVLASAQAPDDSGMAACYNINFFDNSTGQFQANMLVYKLNSPNGTWNNVDSGSLRLSLTFPSAGIQMTSNNTPTAAPMFRRDLSTRAGGPTLMDAYTLVGSINAPFNGSANLMNATAMRMALAPTVNMTASANGMMLSTNLTAPPGAAFVSGWFSDADITMRQAVAAAAASPTPFTLPGVTLAIPLGLFPIGLILTSCWVALFVGAVGYGTFGRLRWRKAYRAQKPGASGK